MATYYFSGIDRQSFIELLAREGAAGMINWRYAAQKAVVPAYSRWPEVKLVLDSGFLDKPSNEQYIKLLIEHGSRFEWFGNNDVIGNQIASDENWQQIRLALPAELRNKLLWIYQDGSMDYLSSKADENRFVGVGGLVPVIKQDVNEALRKIDTIGKTLESVGAKAHFFGVGSPDILLKFRSESWFASADSQSWLCGFKRLELIVSDGSRKTTGALGILLEKAECAAQNIRTIHSWLNNDIQLCFEAMR